MIVTIEKSHQLLGPITCEAQFLEGWVKGTFIVAGIFAIPSVGLTVADLERNIPILHRATKEAKRGWWPRGISAIFLLPVYLGSGFDADTVQWVQKRQPYRWVVWHEPVLYDVQRNEVWMRSEYTSFGCAFFPLVARVYRRAFELIAERLGKPFPEFINGVPANKGGIPSV